MTSHLQLILSVLLAALQ